MLKKYVFLIIYTKVTFNPGGPFGARWLGLSKKGYEFTEQLTFHFLTYVL